jgi:S-layer homology domain.
MKRLIALFLCVFLVLELIPTHVNAAEPTDTKLEKAIVAVKEKIDIPSSYSDFKYNFSTPQSYQDPYWRFTWTNAEGSSIEVNCDEENHIMEYFSYENSQNKDSSPKYLKKELKSTADNFLKQIVPDIASNLYYKEDFDRNNSYNGSYEYYYQRKENEIPVSDNYATVNVDKVTGKVLAFKINWLYGITIPAAKADVTKEDATKLIKNKLNMKLLYQSNYSYDLKLNDVKEKAYLAYMPNKSYIAVDAKTGKIYTEKYSEVYNNASMSVSADSMGSNKSATTVQLSESEMNEIASLKELITKDAAIKAVKNNKYLLIDKNLKKTKATLEKVSDSKDKSSYMWNIEMSDPRKVKDEKDSYRAFAYAMVDAKTGKIVFYMTSGIDNNKKIKVNYNKKTGQKLAEQFLKKEVPEQFKNTKFSDVTNDIGYYDKKGKAVYSGYGYIYNRVSQNIEFPNNGIQANIDSETGKIYSFRLNWSDNVVFESSVGVMTEDKAKDTYLGKDGYQLAYDIYQTNKYSDKDSDSKQEYQVRLVYSTNIFPSSISPFTGDQLNYDGSVYTTAKQFRYVDVDNIDQYRNVYLLSDMNIGFEGDHFYPDKEITVGEMNQLFSNLGYGLITDANDTNSTKLITREEMASYFIKNLGLDKVSQLQGIYATGYYDQSSIDSKYIGAVALAKGFGIMSGDSNNNFNPKKNVTRLDAVNMLMYYLKLDNLR